MHTLRSGDCVSSNGNSVQLSVQTGGDAALALDNDINTFSCTDDDQALPWWVVDLGAHYTLASVHITLPTSDADDRNYQRYIQSSTHYTDYRYEWFISYSRCTCHH